MIGETLRTARERQQLSLPAAAELTRIQQRFLQALEDEAFGELGEDVYVRGFLRSYARTLGVDADRLLEIYRTEHASPQPDEAALTGQVLAGAPAGSPRALRAVGAATAVALAIGLLVLLSQQGTSVTAIPPVETAAPASLPSPAATVPPSPAALSAPERHGEPEAEASPTPRALENVVEVEVEVLVADSWLRVVADGTLAFEGIQPAGTTRTFTADEEIQLRIGNAGAVSIRVNGEDEGVIGAPGEVVDRVFEASERR